MPYVGGMDTIIDVANLHKRYGSVVAVDDVSFTVTRGEIFGLLGPNGAGKTTAIEIVQGLRRRDRGQVTVLGLDPQKDQNRLRSRIGSQLQHSALPDRIRVAEAIELFGRWHGHHTDLADTLEAWHLTEVARRPFGALSGGQKQRLFLALALLGRPEVVFLDELTAALDPSARRSTWDLVRGIRDQGTTVILVTHFMEEAEALCDRVAVIDRGQIVALDTPRGLSAASGLPIRTEFEAPGTDAAFLADVAGVARVTATEPSHVSVWGDENSPLAVAATLHAKGIAASGFRTHHPNLEDAFLALTGTELRGDKSA